MKKVFLTITLAIASVIVFAAGHTVSITSQTNASCNGMCDGTATASVSGAVGPISYNWTPGNPAGDGTNYVYSLCAGSYYVTVTDSSDMSTASDTVIILQPTPVIVSLPSFYSICAGGCLNFNAVPSGGTPGYTYDWVPSAPLSSGTISNPTVCPTTSSSYTVTVRDANLCIGTAVTSVNLTPPMIVTANTTPSNCSACDGTATLSITGATLPITCFWTPGGGTFGPNAINLCVGTYTVTVTDGMGCNGTALAVVGNSTSLSAFYTSSTASNCTSPTGSITVDSISGGVAPFTYSINYGAFGSGSVFTGLSPGPYTIGVKDANGCLLTQGVTVNPINPAIITLDSVNDIGCSGVGGIYISVSGGTPPYSYSWAPAGITTQDYTTVTSPGSYSLGVIDAAGCSSYGSYSITNLSTLYGTVSSTMGNCSVLPTLTATGHGGAPPYTYSWNTVPVQTTPTATGLSSGYYTCTITDSAGCTRTVTAYAHYNCYNVVRGRIYNDINGNCIQDAGELGIAGRVVHTVSTWGYGYTDMSGDYIIHLASMTNTVTHTNPLYSVVVCPVGNMQPANFTTLGDTLYNIDFAVQTIPAMNDLEVHYYPGVARPGFHQYGTLQYKNVGTTVITGVTVSLTHDSILSFNSSSPVFASYAYPALSWNIGTLNPGQTGNILIDYTVPVISAGGYLGRVLTYTAQIDPAGGDQTPANNSTVSTTAITGSYDPNDKAVSPSGDILASDSILNYTIRFQNSGTDTAFTIVLKDTLSPYLDPATVVPGIASHAFDFDISMNGILTWTFNNILLPDSNINEPASHGFATFTVRQRSSNVIGDEIENTAHIYFDFNEAVVTNTVVSEIVDLSTGIETTSSNGSVKVYPNPFSDQTTFVISSPGQNETYSFEMTDVLGKIVLRKNGIMDKQFSISRNGLQNGIYFYRIYGSETTINKGKIIIK
jgi:hypothetical protein